MVDLWRIRIWRYLTWVERSCKLRTLLLVSDQTFSNKHDHFWATRWQQSTTVDSKEHHTKVEHQSSNCFVLYLFSSKHTIYQHWFSPCVLFARVITWVFLQKLKADPHDWHHPHSITEIRIRGKALCLMVACICVHVCVCVHCAHVCRHLINIFD